MADGHETRDRHDTASWTGKPDPVAPMALAIALALGALCLLVIGVFALG